MPGKPRAPSRPGAAVAGAAVTTNGARAAAPPPARQEAAQEAESAKKSGGKRFTWLIILGAVLGGLAMSALGAGIAVALLLPGEKPGEAVAAGEGDSTNENSNEATTGESDNNADGGAATGGEDGDNEQENGDDGENGGAEDDPELPQPGAGDEPEENGSGSENVGEVPPPVEPPVSPPEGEPGSEEPPAEEPPKEKPPAEKPPKEQPPQEKPKDPFRELVKAYDLPMPKSDGEGTPVNLGKVLLPEDGIVYIDLLGGDKAVPKEKGTFSLARARGGLAERDWEFKLTTGADTETVIANMTLKENDLLFKWAPEAAGSDIVEYLANCQLNLRTRDAEHFLGLRDVQQVEALPVRFDQALLRERYKIPGAPDPKSMVVEITKVEGAKATIVKPTLTAAQDTTIVSFGEGDEQLLGVKIDTAMQKDLQITVTPVMKGPGGAPIKFNLRQVSSLYNQTLAAVTQMQSVVKQIDKGKYKNDKEKKQAKQRAEAKLKQLEEGLASFDTLNKQYEQISGKAYVQFRVYLPDGDSKLELVQGIKPPPAPDAPEKEEP